jgi:hypothetical protein
MEKTLDAIEKKISFDLPETDDCFHIHYLGEHV